MDVTDKQIGNLLDEGFTEDEIAEALRGSKPAPSGSMRRGDELSQPDPSPSDVISTGRPKRPPPSGGPDPDVVALPELRRALAGTSTPGAAPADDKAEAEDFARFALGGLVGMGASSAARALGAGGRTSGIIGGAAGGASPALSEPDAKPKDIVTAALMGGALGAVGAPRGKRNVAKSQAGRAANAIERVTSDNPDAPRGPIYERPPLIGRSEPMAPELRMTRPAGGGMFDEPAYRDLPDGDPGTMRMAEDARGQIVGDLTARDAANRAGLDAAEGELESFIGPETRVSERPVTARIDALRAENSNNPAGIPIDDALDSRLGHYKAALTPRQPRAQGPVAPDLVSEAETVEQMAAMARNHAESLPPGAARDAAHAEAGAYASEGRRLRRDAARKIISQRQAENADPEGVTFGQLRGLQKSLNAEAQGGMPGTAENRPARMAQGAMRSAVREMDPREGPGNIGGALDRYGEEATRLDDARNALYGGEGAIRDAEGMFPRDDKAARGQLAQYGKGGSAAANTGITLDQLAAQSPLYRGQLDRLGARNAEDILALQLSMPGGAGIAQGVSRTIGHNLGAAGERFFRPATGIGYDGAGPGAAQLQLDPLIQLLLQEDRR